MKRKTLGLLLFIMSILLVACSNMQRGSAGTSSSSTVTPESTRVNVIKLQDSEIFCPSKNKEAQKFYNDANILKTDGKFAEAEKLYLKAIELDPNYCDAMDNLGQLLRQQNRVDEAIEWYEKSLEIKSDNTVALQNIALAYNLQGRTEKAMEMYERLVEVAPENPEGYFGLGTIYFGLEQPEKAIPYLETAEKLYAENASPYQADAQYYLGFSHFMLQDFVSAKKYLEPIYAQFSDSGGINYVLGVCYLKAEPQNKELARKYILKAQNLGIQIPPDILSAINEE